MKARVVLALVLLGFFVLIGCTGCDPQGGSTTVDLTRNAEILTNELGWEAQETYEFTDDDGNHLYDLCYLLFITVNTDTFSVVYVDENMQGFGTVAFTVEDAGPVIFDSPDIGCQEVRITASEDSPPVLSLTDTDTGVKRYFSMGGSGS